MRQCSNCGATLDDDALFCTVCGTRNEIMSSPQRQCPHCGAALDDDAVFCTYCGQKVLQTDRPVGAPVWSPDVQAQKPVEPTALKVGGKPASTIRPWHYALGIGVLLIILAAIFVPKILKDYGKAAQKNVAEQSDSTVIADFSEENEPQEVTDDSSEAFNYEGRYAYQGSIGENEFRINFGIKDHHIEGEYALSFSTESLSLKGTITDNGTFEMYEYAKDGTKTGWYLTGQFNPDDFRGHRLLTETDIDMSFEAVPMELDSPVIFEELSSPAIVKTKDEFDEELAAALAADMDDIELSTDDEPLSLEAEDDRIYEMVEENAQFPGGDDACFKWLSEHIKYPEVCAEQGVQGRVLVSFVINRDGSIVDVKTIRSPDASLSQEAERVVRMMPKWKPARQGGKIVRSRFALPVMFRLN